MKTADKRRSAGGSAAAGPQGSGGMVGVAAGTETGAVERPLKPHQCRNHLRKTVAAAFRDITAGFVEEAKSGSCQHLKMATEIVESKKRGKKGARPQGAAAALLEELDGEFSG